MKRDFVRVVTYR